MGHQLGPELERLAALVGRWRTSGWTRETADTPALQIAATDTYEWLPGRFALLHTVDAHIADIEGNYPSKGTGERAAWFRDSEGNMIGIGEPLRD
jgi:hypothetical protein